MYCVFLYYCCCFFKQKTAYGMRISDWSSDVCSSDLLSLERLVEVAGKVFGGGEEEGAAITRLRHRRALEDCHEALSRAQTAELPELRAEELRLAARALGRITGRVDVEDLLDIVFRDFCIGK